MSRGRRLQEHREAVDDNPRFNYGTAHSLRESVSGGSYTRYFQKQDTTMYAKILEAEIYDAIVTFLDRHDVDTSELREQRFTMLNNGVIVQGGNVNANALAVGLGAQARSASGLMQQLRPSVPQPTRKPPQPAGGA